MCAAFDYQLDVLAQRCDQVVKATAAPTTFRRGSQGHFVNNELGAVGESWWITSTSGLALHGFEPALPLLHDMSQLMSNQPAAVWRCRCELIGAEDDIPPYGISMAVELLGRIGRPRVGVDPHMAETPAKPRLEIAACRRVEWFPRQMQRLMHASGYIAGDSLRRVGCPGLQRPHRWSSEGKSRFRCPHYVVGDAVRFIFENVVNRSHRRQACWSSPHRRDWSYGLSRHPHHLVGDAVCLVIDWVIDGPEGVLILNHRARR